MPLRAKQWAIGMIVVFVGLSAWLLPNWWLRAVVVLAGGVGIVVIAHQRTRVPVDAPGERDPTHDPGR